MPELPAWAAWSSRAALHPWTVGIEEEVLLLQPGTWAPANRIDDVMAVLPPALAAQTAAETHACVAELHTVPHTTVAAAAAELAGLRRALAAAMWDGAELRVAAAGTHPLATRRQVAVSARARYRIVLATTRALARREPTLAQHVHVAVPGPEAAVRALDGLRADLPTLLALAANSPYWRAADSGFASIRTPIFSAFPRTGLPRAFGSYAGFVAAVDPLVHAGAIPDVRFLWWDARLQPRLGTVEVRIMDAQSRSEDAAALAAVVQCLVRLHAGGEAPPGPGQEVLEENRFLAARDGLDAVFVGGRPARAALAELLERCAPFAAELHCTAELEDAARLAEDPGAARQRRLAERYGIEAVPAWLAGEFAPSRSVEPVLAG